MNIDAEQVIREYLPDVVHMSLATATKDGQPWVCEVHFAYDQKLNLYFRSLASRRHSQELAENPRVAGNIVRQHALSDAAVGVYFEGTAKMLQPGDELDEAYKALSARLGFGEEKLEEAKDPNGHQFYKISVENWYVFGRFGAPSGQKFQLQWNGGKNE